MFGPASLPSTARRGAVALLAVGLIGGAASPAGAAKRVFVG
ncbi:MAG: hypothetical protein Q7T55_24490 [Solirubrobacteraceae bacterium]|nr:hypothetical protein [Solirubrobacteraceae bacterium]